MDGHFHHSDHSGIHAFHQPVLGMGGDEECCKHRMLSIVLHTESGESYISRREVPVGTDILNSEYWAVRSRFFQQIKDMETHLQETEGRMNQNLSETETRMAKDLHSTKDAMSEELTSTKTAMSEELAQTEQRVTKGRYGADPYFTNMLSGGDWT